MLKFAFLRYNYVCYLKYEQECVLCDKKREAQASVLYRVKHELRVHELRSEKNIRDKSRKLVKES